MGSRDVVRPSSVSERRPHASQVRPRRRQVQCPHCDKQLRETVGQLRDDPLVTCPKCGTKFRYRGSLPRLLAQVAGHKIEQVFNRLARF